MCKVLGKRAKNMEGRGSGLVRLGCREKQDCRGSGRWTGTWQRLNFITKSTGDLGRVLRRRMTSSMF